MYPERPALLDSITCDTRPAPMGPAPFGRPNGSGSPAATHDGTGGRRVQPVLAGVLGIFLVLVQHRIGQVSEMGLLAQFPHTVVGQERATLRKRTTIKQGKYWPSYFLEHFVAAVFWCHDLAPQPYTS